MVDKTSMEKASGFTLPFSQHLTEHWDAFALAFIFILSHLGIVGYGIYSISTTYDGALKSCDHNFNLRRYAWLSVALWGCALLSYFLFKGGDESARGRALFLMIIHAAAGVWGILTWYTMDTDCESYYERAYLQLWHFFRAATFINMGIGLLYLVHELLAAFNILGFDATLLFEWDEEFQDEEEDWQEVVGEEISNDGDEVDDLPPMLEHVVVTNNAPPSVHSLPPAL